MPKNFDQVLDRKKKEREARKTQENLTNDLPVTPLSIHSSVFEFDIRRPSTISIEIQTDEINDSEHQDKVQDKVDASTQFIEDDILETGCAIVKTKSSQKDLSNKRQKRELPKRKAKLNKSL